MSDSNDEPAGEPRSIRRRELLGSMCVAGMAPLGVETTRGGGQVAVPGTDRELRVEHVVAVEENRVSDLATAPPDVWGIGDTVKFRITVAPANGGMFSDEVQFHIRFRDIADEGYIDAGWFGDNESDVRLKSVDFTRDLDIEGRHTVEQSVEIADAVDRAINGAKPSLVFTDEVGLWVRPANGDDVTVTDDCEEGPTCIEPGDISVHVGMVDIAGAVLSLTALWSAATTAATGFKPGAEDVVLFTVDQTDELVRLQEALDDRDPDGIEEHAEALLAESGVEEDTAGSVANHLRLGFQDGPGSYHFILAAGEMMSEVDLSDLRAAATAIFKFLFGGFLQLPAVFVSVLRRILNYQAPDDVLETGPAGGSNDAPGRRPISGFVLDADDEPMTDVSVRVYDQDPRSADHPPMFRLTTDSDGRFRSEKVGPRTAEILWFELRRNGRLLRETPLTRSYKPDVPGIFDYHLHGVESADPTVDSTISTREREDGRIEAQVTFGVDDARSDLTAWDSAGGVHVRAVNGRLHRADPGEFPTRHQSDDLGNPVPRVEDASMVEFTTDESLDPGSSRQTGPIVVERIDETDPLVIEHRAWGFDTDNPIRAGGQQHPIIARSPTGPNYNRHVIDEMYEFFHYPVNTVEALAGNDDWHTLTIDGQGTDSQTDYTFAVTGEVAAEEGIGTGDSIDGSTAEGFVQGGTDKYRFTGELESYDLDGGDAVLYVDGERRDSAGGADTEWRTLTLEGDDTDTRTDYTFEVSGDLRASAGIGTGDSIDGSTAEGFVRGGSDIYEFTGELESYDLEGGDAVLYVDGERIANAAEELDVEVGYLDQLSHFVTVEGQRFDRVELRMYNGAREVFTAPWEEEEHRDFDDEKDRMSFGFDKTYPHWGEIVWPVETYSEFDGPIEEVVVANGDATKTFTCEVEGSIKSVEFAESAVTVSVVGDEWQYNDAFENVLIEFADGSHDLRNEESINGSRTFEYPDKTIEVAQFGPPSQYEIRWPNPNATDADEEWKTLTLEGQDTDNRTDYTFEVSGDLREGEGIGTGDDIDGSTAEGFVRGGADVYEFTGELESYELDGGDAVLYVDGERRDSAGTDDTTQWRTIELDGRDTDSQTDYTFEVSGDLREGEGIGTGDSIDGSMAEGFVQGGSDIYEFTGELESYDLEGGDAVLYVDGERRDSAGGADTEWRTLTLEGDDTDTRTDYTFEVSGDLREGEGIGTGDEIEGSTAEGFVRGGSDTYEFTGELESYDLEGGDAVLYVGGERIASADG